MKLTIELDSEIDGMEMIDIYKNAYGYSFVNHAIKEDIRNKIKWANLPEAQQEILEELQQTIFELEVTYGISD
jgi:hypothetical protein